MTLWMVEMRRDDDGEEGGVIVEAADEVTAGEIAEADRQGWHMVEVMRCDPGEFLAELERVGLILRATRH